MGYDAAKKIQGIKYHILVETLGLMLHVVAHPANIQANIQDREGALLLLDKKTGAPFPFIQVIFADGGYAGRATAAALGQIGPWQLSIVQRSDQVKGFVVLPKRWIVERTLAWLSRCRRLIRNYEHRLQTAVAFVRLAMIRLMVRRLCRQ